MADTSSNRPPADHNSRRRALLGVVLGAGIPLSEKVLAGKWITPVVDAVVLPAHAGGSPPPIEFPLRFGSAVEMGMLERGRAMFADVAQRTEEEILNLFISTAEANTCDTNSCAADAPVEVEVVATIDGDPSNSACIQARVIIDEGASCSSKCQMFTFDATVDDGVVTIDNSCQLTLTNMTYAMDELKGDWEYNAGSVNRSGDFTSPVNPGRGCGTLSCPV